jgi:hypothetical protein
MGRRAGHGGVEAGDVVNGQGRITASLLVAASVLSGCVSATPRPYAPVVRPPPADSVTFEREFDACAAAVGAGKRNFRQSGGAIAVGGVGGVAAVQVLSAAAAAGSLGASATTALAASGVGLVMVVPLMTYSLSSSRRRHNEQEIQKAMTECLAPSGYTVTTWTLIPRRDAASAPTLTPTRPTAPPVL